MSDDLLRIYTRLDSAHIKPNLLVYGDVSGSCANCENLDIKLDQASCFKCKTEFKFIAFRNVRSHLPKIYKLFETRPNVTLIDFDDYQRNTAAKKAKNFLK